MNAIVILLLTSSVSLEIGYCQENLEPYGKYDSLQRISEQSLLIESGSYKKASFYADAIYVIRLDDPLYILKYAANGSTEIIANSEKKFLKRYIRKLASLPDYKCPLHIKARDKKWLKGRDYDHYWRYRLVGESKNGEGRVKRPLVNDCLSPLAALKERKTVNKILKRLDNLPSAELISRK